MLEYDGDNKPVNYAPNLYLNMVFPARVWYTLTLPSLCLFILIIYSFIY